MRMFLVRIGIAVVSVWLIEQWPFPVLPGLWVLLIWSLPRAVQDRREIRRLRPMAGLLVLRIDALEGELTTALDANAALQNRVRELQDRDAPTHDASRGKAAGHPLYRKVGLDQDCPRWVAEAVRREYRKRLHPDGKPPNQKAEAERRFQEAEEVFGEIWQIREF